MRSNNLLFSFLAATSLFSFVAGAADDLEALVGKWSVKNVNDQGQEYTQTIVVKKDKLIFQVVGADDRVVEYAEGDLKLDKLGPFKTVHFIHIRDGKSASDLSDVDDDFLSICRLEGDTWAVASNFDKERDHQKPSLDVYRRVKTTVEAATLVIDEIEMADTPQSSTWFLCFDARVEGVTRTYHVEGKGYNKSQVTIPVALELPKIRAGQKCNFTLKLDDVEDDACTEEVDNKSAGDFTVSDKGAQTYKPEDNWRYTIRWHLK